MDIVILHGVGGYPGKHWQGWLGDKCEARGHSVHMPALPKSDAPARAEWLAKVKEVCADIAAKDLVLVGHSLGVTTAMDFVATRSESVRALISVAGFAHDYGSELNTVFLKSSELNLSDVRRNVAEPFVLYGDDDPYVPQTVLHSLAVALGVAPVVFPNGGHLNTDSGFQTFPELLEILRSLEAS